MKELTDVTDVNMALLNQETTSYGSAWRTAEYEGT